MTSPTDNTHTALPAGPDPAGVLASAPDAPPCHRCGGFGQVPAPVEGEWIAPGVQVVPAVQRLQPCPECAPVPDALPPVETLAGEALAEAVAVEVMGWHLHDNGLPDRRHRRYWQGAEGRVERHFERWRPDCQIADAWQVVEHLKAQRKPASIICRTGCFEDFDELGWEVTFRRSPTGYAFDEHLPVAICRAALAAVRAQKGDAEPQEPACRRCHEGQPVERGGDGAWWHLDGKWRARCKTPDAHEQKGGAR